MRVYMAGAYSADNIIKVLNNMHNGIKMSVKILKMGYVPFCPWLDFQFQFFDNTLTVEDYYRYSIAWLEVSDVVFVLPNSEKSKGTQAEIKRAKELNIPIVESIEELNKLKRNLTNKKIKEFKK